jgi:hypothetical protein
VVRRRIYMACKAPKDVGHREALHLQIPSGVRRGLFSYFVLKMVYFLTLGSKLLQVCAFRLGSLSGSPHKRNHLRLHYSGHSFRPTARQTDESLPLSVWKRSFEAKRHLSRLGNSDITL